MITAKEAREISNPKILFSIFLASQEKRIEKEIVCAAELGQNSVTLTFKEFPIVIQKHFEDYITNLGYMFSLNRLKHNYLCGGEHEGYDYTYEVIISW